MISVLTQLASMLILRTRKPFFASRPGGLLLCSTIAVAAVASVAPFWGVLSSAFGFVQLPLLQVAATVVILTGYIAATEIAKIWFVRSRWSVQDDSH